jgi:hypothetical protein
LDNDTPQFDGTHILKTLARPCHTNVVMFASADFESKQKAALLLFQEEKVKNARMASADPWVGREGSAPPAKRRKNQPIPEGCEVVDMTGGAYDEVD